MLNSYNDIRDRIKEEPKWWDEAGVPRYCEFEPYETANIYADEAALVLISCQNCGRKFQVVLSSAGYSRLSNRMWGVRERIMNKTLHYGDPPNIGCCPAGPTMNSTPERVLEYWRQISPMVDWKRDSSLEVDIRPDWAKDEATGQPGQPESVRNTGKPQEGKGER